MQFLRGLLTEDDQGKVFCPVRTFGGLGMLTFLGLSAFATIHSSTHSFEMIAFGTGFAALLAALAGGIAAKSKLGADYEESGLPEKPPAKKPSSK